MSEILKPIQGKKIYQSGKYAIFEFEIQHGKNIFKVLKRKFFGYRFIEGWTWYDKQAALDQLNKLKHSTVK